MTFTDTTGNYNDASRTFMDTIAKANAVISVVPYSVTYDGAWHNAAGSALGLSGLTVSSAHQNAGYYTDSWTFIDSTGNYNNASGQFGDNIARANAAIVVNGYNVNFDGANHAATGAAYGVNGVVAGLDLSSTVHSNVGTHNDTWTFNNANYNYASGTVVSLISPAPVSVVRVSTEWVQVLVRYQKVGCGKHAVLKPIYKRVQVLQVQFSGAVTTAQRVNDYALSTTPLCGKARPHAVALSQVKLTANNTVQLTTSKPLQLHPMQKLVIGTKDSAGRALVGRVVATFNKFGTWLR